MSTVHVWFLYCVGVLTVVYIFFHGLQIIGPFSFRVDSGVAVNLHPNREWKVNLENPVLAIEYALHVLGSAKAVAWYAPRQKEFMVELRFFER